MPDKTPNEPIVLATRIKKEDYQISRENITDRLSGYANRNFSIEKLIVVTDSDKEFKLNNVTCETIFDSYPTRPTAFNKVVEKLNKTKQTTQPHLLTFSKEVKFGVEHINTLVEKITGKEERGEGDSRNMIVVGYKLRDNVSSDTEMRLFENRDVRTNDVGIAYKVPWSTFALWNKKFVYGDNELRLVFDEICEPENHQFGELTVNINGNSETTSYKGMEDGLAIARIIHYSPNKLLNYELIKEPIDWEIENDAKRILEHKKKLARKNIVLSTFMNVRGYSVEQLARADMVWNPNLSNLKNLDE